MHIYFSGIGGAGIGPLAQVALEAGYDVSGSDKQDSDYIQYLRQHGVNDIHIGQNYDSIKELHSNKPIDWLVYTSALTLEQVNPDELRFCTDNGIKATKRDELLNQILKDKQLELIAIAGTHGKTTTTAMVVWLLTQSVYPTSYLLPAKTSYAELGHYDPNSKVFIYEADEFDRNFLAFKPSISLISGVSFDHQEIYPTKESYNEAFNQFIGQSDSTYIWQSDKDYLNTSNNVNIIDDNDSLLREITLAGLYNRRDGLLAIKAVSQITNKDNRELIQLLNRFPGLSRRMELIAPNLYSDYAHTPEKIRGAISAASEIADHNQQKLIVVYEPLTDRRQHYIIDQYKDCFNGVSKLYWIPSYLAREDETQTILTPSELISHLSDPSIAEAKERNDDLKTIIDKHLVNNDMVVAIAGGGGNSLDTWLRSNYA